jgi:hypothetical protein
MGKCKIRCSSFGGLDAVSLCDLGWTWESLCSELLARKSEPMALVLSVPWLKFEVGGA